MRIINASITVLTVMATSYFCIVDAARAFNAVAGGMIGQTAVLQLGCSAIFAVTAFKSFRHAKVIAGEASICALATTLLLLAPGQPDLETYVVYAASLLLLFVAAAVFAMRED